MPGIYVSDGGGISSALGNILGGMANNLGPEAAAKAQLLKLQAEEADRKNSLLSNTQRGVLAIQPGLEAAGATGPAAPTDPGIVTTQPATGVAGAVASTAVPPESDPMAPFARDQTRNFSPYAQIVAGSYANNPSMENFKTGVDLGRDITQGPGHDFATENEIAKQRLLPYDISAPTTRHFPGMGPGGADVVVEGGDAAATAGESKQRGLDIDDAKTRVDLAENAGKSIQEATRLRDIYNTLVAQPGGDDTLANFTDEALKTLSASTGYNFTRNSGRIDAVDAIRRRMQALAGNAVQSVAVGTPPRGILENANQTLANPESGKEQFNSAVEQMLRTYKAQMELGAPAVKFRGSHFTKEDSDLYKSEVQAIIDRQNKEFQPDSAAKPPPPASASPPAVDSARELVYAREALNQGRKREDIIARAKQRGVDLEKLGF